VNEGPTVVMTMADAVIEAVADAVAARLSAAGANDQRSPWLTGAHAAAEYLGWPKARIDKHIRQMPHRRHGGRLMFRRDELDTWLDDFYEGPARPLELSKFPTIRHPASRSRSVPEDAEGA
jgi:hypothetical protein